MTSLDPGEPTELMIWESEHPELFEKDRCVVSIQYEAIGGLIRLFIGIESFADLACKSLLCNSVGFNFVRFRRILAWRIKISICFIHLNSGKANIYGIWCCFISLH